MVMSHPTHSPWRQKKSIPLAKAWAALEHLINNRWNYSKVRVRDVASVMLANILFLWSSAHCSVVSSHCTTAGVSGGEQCTGPAKGTIHILQPGHPEVLKQDSL